VLDAGVLASGLGWVSRTVLALEPALSRLATVVITNSEAGSARSIARGFQRHKLRLVPNGIDVDRFVPAADARDRIRREMGTQECLVVGVVARLDPIKDHVTFLRAAAIMAATRSDVHFVVVGGGPAEYRATLERIALDLGVSNRVTFAGPRNDVADVISSFDIGTLTSLAEGFPNAVGELMAAGLPCVVTNAGDCARLVGETGLVVPPSDPPALAGAWSRIGALPREQRLRLGGHARHRVQTLFSVNTMVHNTEEVLDGLLASKGSQRPRALASGSDMHEP
jgi:glycosyltransferase involved in cell wall biosynthesis